MSSINIVHDQLVQLAKDKNLTYKEILVKLAEYRKALKIFKARLPLVKCLEINFVRCKIFVEGFHHFAALN